jgi:hypothetical protein
MHSTLSRRRFLTGSSAGAASLIGLLNSLAQEAPPETTAVRFPISNNICFAPLYVADELLRAEGFTDIRYVPTGSGATGAGLVARGEADFDNAFVGTQMTLICRPVSRKKAPPSSQALVSRSLQSAGPGWLARVPRPTAPTVLDDLRRNGIRKSCSCPRRSPSRAVWYPGRRQNRQADNTGMV